MLQALLSIGIALALQATETRTVSIEECPLARVIDGDTIHVMRHGRLEKLRLLCVDTEETTRSTGGSKPSTTFGDRTSAHIKKLLHCDEQGNPLDRENPVRIRIEHEGPGEQRGNFGRLLCYVYLGDLQLNRMLIAEGWSPYYTKYGFSGRYHAEFLEAEREARESRRGLWDPATDPSGQRPDYAVLQPWWNARARALQSFEKLRANGAEILGAEELESMKARAGKKTTVFGGAFSLAVERRAARILLEGHPDSPVEIVVPLELLDEDVLERLGRLCLEGEQNFFYARGTIQATSRSLQVHVETKRELGWSGPPN